MGEEAASAYETALSSLVLFLAVLGGAGGQEPPVHDVVVAVFAAGGRSPLQAFIGNGLVLELSRNRFRATLVEINAPVPPGDDIRPIVGLAREPPLPLPWPPSTRSRAT